jgi:hypothetical protein
LLAEAVAFAVVVAAGVLFAVAAVAGVPVVVAFTVGDVEPDVVGEPLTTDVLGEVAGVLWSSRRWIDSATSASSTTPTSTLPPMTSRFCRARR